MKESKNKKNINSKRLVFESSFDPGTKQRIKTFLNSGSTVASFTKALLLLAATGGVLSVGIAAPGLIKAFGLTTGYKKLNSDGFKKFERSYYELRRKKYIYEDPSGSYRLTDSGKREILKFLDSRIVTRPKKWDGKWRIVFFDIPDTLRRNRDVFRRRLVSSGFYILQKSVLIYPFQCSDEVLRHAGDLGVKKFVEVYTVTDYDNPRVLQRFEKEIRRHLN